MTDTGLKLPVRAPIGESGIREWIRNAATIWNSRIDSVSGVAGDALGQVPATGDFRLIAGSTYGSDWLLCDGSAVSRTTYAALFTKIGTTYGSGDGSTTFNLPTVKAFILDNGEGFSLDTMEKSTWNIIIRT